MQCFSQLTPLHHNTTPITDPSTIFLPVLGPRWLVAATLQCNTAHQSHLYSPSFKHWPTKMDKLNNRYRDSSAVVSCCHTAVIHCKLKSTSQVSSKELLINHVIVYPSLSCVVHCAHCSLLWMREGGDSYIL